MVKYGDEIFEDSPEAAISVIWWLLDKLGGKVEVPLEGEIWNNQIPLDASLVMYKEDGKLILEAERLDQS